MRLPPFELLEPATVDEVVDVLGRDADARPVAGGTALVPMLRLGLLRPARLVSLDGVAGLDTLAAEDGALAVGAMVTHARLARDERVRRGWPLLADAAGRVATPAIRSTGTLGGSLGYAEAASDTAPALLCLEAEVRVTGPAGPRAIPVTDFFRGFYETALEPGELVTGVRVPAPPAGARGGYVKYTSRSAEDRPLVGVAALLVRDGAGRCADVRIALGNAAPVPMRAARAEATLRDEVVTDDAIEAAAGAAAGEADPISDLMGSAAYRRRMIHVWTRRLLAALRDGAPVAGAHPA